MSPCCEQPSRCSHWLPRCQSTTDIDPGIYMMSYTMGSLLHSAILWLLLRSVENITSHFRSLQNRLCSLDVTWQPIRGDFTAQAETFSCEINLSAVRHHWMRLYIQWLLHLQWLNEYILYILRYFAKFQIWLPANSGHYLQQYELLSTDSCPRKKCQYQNLIWDLLIET